MMFQPKLLTTLRGYNRKMFLNDLIAGVIVGVVALPLAIAFGIASGVSPEKGLITAIIAGFLISALGGSRVQIGGPTGAFIVIVYGIVEQHGVSGLVIATIMAGIMLIAMGMLRLGSIIKFMPHPIIVGFTSGIAVVIFSSQIKDFFGLQIDDAVPAGFIEKWTFYFEHSHTIDWISFTIALGTVLLSVLWPKVNKKIPGSILAIIFATLVVSLFNLPVETIGSRFGEIPSTFPSPRVPSVNYSTFKMLLGPAFTIAILGAIESLLSAMVADGAIGGKHRSNTELIAQGVANVITPLFGGMPATGAIARTMVNIRNGGLTPVAGIVHALVLLFILLFFGSWAKLIPMACLAGILVVVSYNMSEWRSFRGLLRNSKSDISVLLITFFLTVFIDLSVAIQFGVLLAMILFVRRVMETTQIAVLQTEVEEDGSLFIDENEKIEIPKGVEVYEINGPFFFGVANKFEEAEKQVGAGSKVRIIRMRRVPFIDSTGLKNLRSFVERSLRSGCQIILSGVNKDVEKALQKDGLSKIIGQENIHPSIAEALKRAEQLSRID
ncbi:MAG: sulfate permease [Bacteroidales bacterium]|nr:sulfate permease [Bacteroidales bacterium]